MFLLFGRWREVSGGFMSQDMLLEDSRHEDSLRNTVLNHRENYS